LPADAASTAIALGAKGKKENDVPEKVEMPHAYDILLFGESQSREWQHGAHTIARRFFCIVFSDRPCIARP